MEENEGLSLGDIFRTIFSQKWLALIIAVAITLIGTLGICLVYNPLVSEYEVEFKLNLPNAAETSWSYTYPDGKIFYYTEMISEESLLNIKNSNTDFKDIDVEKMAGSGAITLESELTTTDMGNTSSYLVDRKFTIKVKSSFFKSADIARRFLMAVITAPGEYLNNMNINYNVYISLAGDAIEYSTELSYLQYQASYLQNLYGSLIGTFGANYTVLDSRTLQSYLQSLNLYLSENVIENFKTEARENYYLKDESLREKYRLELLDVRREYEIASKTLSDLKTYSTSSDAEGNASVLKDQANYVYSLEQQMNDLVKYQTGPVNTEFGNRIKVVYDKLAEFSEEYERVANIVYSKASTVSFSAANIVVSDGSISFVMALLISLVIGIIVAFIVAYIVGRQKQKKALAEAGIGNMSENAANGTHSEDQAQAQAAVTEDEDKK